ncbi:T9SS type A sorting domain-containing protein [Hymenobacter gummosus]|uniref:T9SS type A sorting domain-containing protein n=1 Tax=Hymenobacter gummosus TaxID=1776032 RepID=A0A3S0HAI0_9BACT|nr:FG-GAP-like repeat-containing protein [Hymenobacter gummosus]RTQ50919.1 T9SS type A sorting domain-containing protein [Hymenobacter gummosus]
MKQLIPSRPRLLPLAPTILATLLSGTATAQGPTLVSSSPARNAVAVPAAGSVGLTFSQAVSAASAGNVRVFGSMRQGLRTGTLSGGGSSALTFQPQQAFMPGEQVSVTVPATVQGTAGAAATPYVYQFRAASAPATATFSGTTNTAIGNNAGAPSAVQVADLNGDGNLDLVLGDGLGNNLDVRLGNGQGGFGASTNYNFGTIPGQIITADVNNDNKLDLVVSNNGGVTRYVHVALGDGQGAFGTPVALTLPSIIQSMAVVDVNGDGNLDILTFNGPPTFSLDPRTVSVRLGNGTGQFTALPDLPMGTTSKVMATGDIDNDGKMDFVLADFTQSTVQAYFGDGAGGFTVSAAAALSVGANPGSVILADLNNDGNLDVATASTSANSVSVSLGNGRGGFAAASTQALTSGRTPMKLQAADVDGDADLDLLVANNGRTGAAPFPADVVNVLLNGGQAAFTAGSPVPVDLIPVDMAVGDLNNDGTLDLLTINRNNFTYSLRTNARVTAKKAAREELPLAVYPNPAREELTLELPGGSGRATVEILSALGQRVRSFTPTVAGNGRVQLPLQSLQAGMYLVRVSTAAGTATRQFMVE